MKAVMESLPAPAADIAHELSLPQKRGGDRIVLGRREWISLPELGVWPINAKTDTGARTSSLHAEDIRVSSDGSRVTFATHNHYGKRIECEAAVVGRRKVRSSTGEAKIRVFIETEAVFPGGLRMMIRLTLANRAVMRCPMLLGRRALSGFFLIDPQGDHLLGGVRELAPFLPPLPIE